MSCFTGKLIMMLLAMNGYMQNTFAQQKKVINEIAFVCGPCGHADSARQSPDATHAQHTSNQKKVAILIFQGAEIIDFAGPWEVFAQESETVLSVCDGAFFLGNAGLLDGHEATTFFSLIPALQRLAPNAKVVSHKRYVDNGKIVTSAGLSSGIDATFHVVSKYLGLGRTQEIATHLEYNWDPQTKYVRGLLADRHLRRARGVFSQFATKTLLYAGDQSKWEIRLSVDTKMEAHQLARLIEFQLSEAQQWTKVSTQGNNSKWTFTANNKKWSGYASVEAVSKSFDEKIVKLMVSEIN